MNLGEELLFWVLICILKTLLKYIGGLHSYLRHTILMFNPTKSDDVCVQATNLEAIWKQSVDEKSDSFLEYDGKGKVKFNGRGKRNSSIKKERKRNSHVNIVRRMAMMKTIVGNFIQN